MLKNNIDKEFFFFLKNAQLILTNEQQNLSFVMRFIIKFSGKNGKTTWEVFFFI